MSQIIAFPSGGYRYLKGVFQYSAGVAAEPRCEIERARFQQPMPLAEGFRAIAAHLADLARPLAAFCACELRSPAPFTEEGFLAFNREYVGTLEQWGIYRDGANPVARSNVCPEIDPPAMPSFYAFAYTIPARPGARPSFHVAGSGEAPEGKDNYRDDIIRRGDTSADGLREKARYVRRVGDIQLNLRHNLAVAAGKPPLLLLHGFPQTHAMWHRVAPLLAAHFALVLPDLRGYGDSDKPPGDGTHAAYSKRTMAADDVALMRALGFERFAVCGHDRGGRVAHRMALDHPQAVER